MKYRGPPVSFRLLAHRFLKLGMTMLQTRTFLGAPDANNDFTLTYRRGKVAVNAAALCLSAQFAQLAEARPGFAKGFHPSPSSWIFPRRAGRHRAGHRSTVTPPPLQSFRARPGLYAGGGGIFPMACMA